MFTNSYLTSTLPVCPDILDEDGFGDSPRGGGAVCFGSRAIDNFLANNQLSYIIRAHEAHAHGVALSKGAR